MTENRWQLNRAGLINFWYYDDEEFQFEGGKLLLRGSNGSGKSVTMQSLIPLLLDGNKSPERLDPFGSKARKIENYILGEDDSLKDESIGYLYIEYKKQESEQFITIGMGIKAKRGSPVKSWGFSVTDGRRIGKDLMLYKEGVEKIPLSMKELSNRIGNGGQVLENQGDYKKHVNDLLFGFSDLEEYDELIKLLVQLRTPKLSKEFKPSVVYEIMENSLQPLSEDDLRPMSEAIENMDNIKSRFDELKESKVAIDKIKASFDKYNEFMLYDKARLFLDSKKVLSEKENERNTILEEIASASNTIKELKLELEQLVILYSANENKRIELESNDSVKIYEKIAKLSSDFDAIEAQIKNKMNQLESKQSKDIQYKQKIKKLSDELELSNRQIDEIIQELDEYAEEFGFDEQSYLSSELKASLSKEYRFTFVKEQLNKYITLLEKAFEEIKKQEIKIKEYDEILKNLDEAKNNKAEKTVYLDKCRNVLQEIKDEYIEKVLQYNKNNQEMVFNQQDLLLLSREINNLNETSSFEGLSSLYRGKFSSHKESILTLKVEKNTLLKEIKVKKDAKEAEIIEWKSRKEPEPSRDEKVILNRENLKNSGIPFIPFYLAVDFNDIDDVQKGVLEEALIDMGLLDALIIPHEYKNKVFTLDTFGADRYLFAVPELLNHTLETFLHSDTISVSNISKQSISDILCSVIVCEGEAEKVYITKEGNYGTGLIKGKISGNTQSKFIGSSSRKRYKEEMIMELETELREIVNQYQSVLNQIDALDQRIYTLEQEYKALPPFEDLETTMKEIKDAIYDLQRCEEEVKRCIEKETISFKELKGIKEEVYYLTNKVPLNVNVETYRNAINIAREYQKELFELEKYHHAFINQNQAKQLFKEEYESNLRDIEEVNYDLNLNHRKGQEIKLNIQELNEQLKLTDFEAIKLELENCIKLLKEIPDQKITIATKIKELEVKTEYEGKKLQELEKSIEECKIAFENNINSFMAEYKLGYVFNWEEHDEVHIAKRILKEIDTNTIREKEKLANSVYEKYQLNIYALRDYSIQIQTGERLNIVGKVRGKEVNLYKIIEFIDESMEDCQKLLRDKDRELFEDILVNNISKKIRAKIYHSEQWVNKMNNLMESMDTSSGLKFSLRWSSKKRETEEQLDTTELVELLKLDGHLMKQADIDKLSAHFRSKLNEARRLSQDNSDHKTFHLIIKEILDYRHWFEFKLYFLKTGQIKKELTNNAFFQFSGGEKAMAMYVPLFSAVFARYEGARSNSPRIISLDEAFAGVDEKNIRDMFRLLSELKFNFIINSQNLWGDYETIDQLAICELIRYDNADFVTVLRYKWNGKKKELVV